MRESEWEVESERSDLPSVIDVAQREKKLILHKVQKHIMCCLTIWKNVNICLAPRPYLHTNSNLDIMPGHPWVFVGLEVSE